MIRFFLKTLVFVLVVFQTFAQKTNDISLTKLPIEDWQLSKWQTAESIFIHPFNPKKINILNGKQILVGQNGAGVISSSIKSSDVKVRFQFMLGQNADAIFYLQGKYGVNLSNGSILKSDGNTVNPFQNVQKAVGLWQNMEISLDIDDATGIANIEKVILNGLTIQENYLMNQPSKNAPNQEKGSEGNFVFVNNSGTVAIRNFEYAAYTNAKPLSINDLTYEIFETYSWDRQFANKNPNSEKGKSDILTYDLGIPHQNYLLIYRGNLTAEKEGKYTLTLDYAGKCALNVNGKDLQDNKEENYRQPRSHEVELKKGSNTFEIRYNKIWWRPALGFFVSGTGVKPYPLHALSSLPEPTPTNAIWVQPTNEVEMIRSFMLFEGKKRTEVISIGTPQKIHYAFDLNFGSLLYAWKGNFADATEMWHERGEPQLLKPIGLKTQFYGKPNIVFLSNPTDALPDTLDKNQKLIYKGYNLDNQGLPTYNYELNGSIISQKFIPENEGLNCTFQGNGTNLFVRIAEGKTISQIDKGLFLVDNIYVKMDAKAKPMIRNTKNGMEMILGLNGSVSYSIIW